MNHLDRINQLNNEVALLRSQLSDARKQLEADSATIAKLAKDKHEACDLLRRSASYFQETGTLGQQGEFVPNISDRETATAIEVWGFLSRHA